MTKGMGSVSPGNRANGIPRRVDAQTKKEASSHHGAVGRGFGACKIKRRGADGVSKQSAPEATGATAAEGSGDQHIFELLAASGMDHSSNPLVLSRPSEAAVTPALGLV